MAGFSGHHTDCGHNNWGCLGCIWSAVINREFFLDAVDFLIKKYEILRTVRRLALTLYLFASLLYYVQIQMLEQNENCFV
jgi:hypothetical protein